MTSDARIVFATKNISVTDCTAGVGNDHVVVTFPSRSNRPGLDLPGFGESFLQKEGCPAVVVKAGANHWFQIAEWLEALDAIRQITSRFRRVVTYGSSMGGYGAALASGPLKASDVIAISPQYSISRDVVPFEKRWALEARQLRFIHDDMPAAINVDAQLVAIYDPLSPDRAHAVLFEKASPNFVGLPLPFSGHPAGTFLRDIRLLSAMIRRIIRGDDFDRNLWRLRARSRRHDSAVYWSNLATTARVRRPFLAIAAAEKSLNLREDHVALFQLARGLLQVEQYGRAAETLRRCVELRPSAAKYHSFLGLALLRLGQVQQAYECFLPVADSIDRPTWMQLARAARTRDANISRIAMARADALQ